jgi:hypothetical protein
MVFSADIDHSKPIIIEQEESSKEKEDEGVKIDSGKGAKVFYKLETIDFHPVCFVPPDDFPVMVTMDNPDISVVFLFAIYIVYAGVLTSSDQQCNLAGYLLQWLWVLDHKMISSVYTEPALDKARAQYCDRLHQEKILQENIHE